MFHNLFATAGQTPVRLAVCGQTISNSFKPQRSARLAKCTATPSHVFIECRRTNLCLYLQSRIFIEVPTFFLSFSTILGAFAYSRKAQDRRRVIVCPDAAFTGWISAKCDTGDFCKNQSGKSEFRYNWKKNLALLTKI